MFNNIGTNTEIDILNKVTTKLKDCKFFIEKRSKIILFIFFLVFSFGIWSFLFSFHYTVKYGDGLDYAQIAENIHYKKGMITKTYPLLGLNFLKEKGLIEGEWPNWHRFPFPVYSIALMYKLFGVNNFAMAFSSGIFYILLVPLTYLLSVKVLKSTIPAILVTLIMMFNGTLYFNAINGGTETASIFFFVLILYILYENSSTKTYAVIGAIIGVAYYNRFNTIIYLPAMIVFILFYSKEKKIRHIIALNVSFLLITLPWFIYSYIHTNSPLFSINSKAMLAAGTGIYPHGHSLWFGTDNVKEWDFLITYPIQMLKKWLLNVYSTKNIIFKLINVYLFSFFFVGLFAKEESYEKRRLKNLIIFILIIQVLILSFFINFSRPYYPFIPVFIILGVDFFIRSVETLQLRRFGKLLIVGTMVIFCCLNGIKTLILGFTSITVDYSFGSEMQKDLSSLNSLVSPNDVICTDIVVASGRYACSKSLPIPKDYKTIDKIQEDFLPLKYILISPYILTKQIWKEWWPIYKNRPKEINDFVLIKSFPSGLLLYVNKNYKPLEG